MIFTSIVFALFFIIVAVLYYVLPGRFRWVLLLLSSIFFYMHSNPVYIIVPAFIVVVTWYAGIRIEKVSSPEKAHSFYLFAIIANIGTLVFFKYTNFFTSTGFDLVNFTKQKLFHSDEALKNNLLINVLAPLGISYITFQAIGYLIEIKRGNHPAEKNLGHLSTFLLFFQRLQPVLLSGHITFFPSSKKYKHSNTIISVLV